MYKPLGKIADIKRGDRITKSQLVPQGKYPVISGGTKPLGYLNQANRTAASITVAQYGTAGYIDWQDQDFWANDVCYTIFPHKNIDNRFLYYILKSKQRTIYGLVTNAIPAHLPKQRLASIPIPILPLSEQRGIVRILDKFETLTSSLTEGLPREIALRRKQYEYYRGQLLNFPKS